jgi:hypothetical protein
LRAKCASGAQAWKSPPQALGFTQPPKFALLMVRRRCGALRVMLDKVEGDMVHFRPDLNRLK